MRMRRRGLTFEECDLTQNIDTSQMPEVRIITSNELRPAGFTLREVFTQKIQAAA